MSYAEAAKALGIGERKLLDMVKGRLRKVSIQELEGYLNTLERQ
jgi:hypothetical protein